ncbi:hypothetical protein SAMN04487948_101401 [Halogranum amylolyticum]|uniref:LexA-binding, inner membrane-associated hydrolase n=1 Tax=Halogranum amylolyticum TaxID=660520 RepID=A0A1H8N987_9EURY|nr:hypothetical protein [Halogranum amylolyticum]SEO26175.1 hypothetical protein SAMN04487948_101401 [Halogranum amylolyticum]
MMSPTHTATGVVLAAPLLAVAPEFAVAGALAGIVGGVFPDLDLFVGEHRRTLHFPVYYWFLVLPAAVVAAASPSTVTVAVALFALSAAVHSVVDWFGAGPEPRPWADPSEQAVYLHFGNRWLTPKRWVRYDGAPEDLLLTGALSVPGLLLFDGSVRTLTVVGLVVGAGYTLVRKRVPDYVEI